MLELLPLRYRFCVLCIEGILTSSHSAKAVKVLMDRSSYSNNEQNMTTGDSILQIPYNRRSSKRIREAIFPKKLKLCSAQVLLPQTVASFLWTSITLLAQPPRCHEDLLQVLQLTQSHAAQGVGNYSSGAKQNVIFTSTECGLINVQ